VEDAAALQRLVTIVRRALPERPVVVVSAMGDTTDVLVSCLERAARGGEEAACEGLRALEGRTSAAIRSFFDPESAERVRCAVRGNFEELERMARAVSVLRSVPPASRDHFLAHGERISAAIVAAALQARGVPVLAADSREILITDDHFGRARPDAAETERRARRILAPACARGEVPVAGGFIGATPQGETTTLGRGGSDWSASLFGAALGATAVEIWTDVSGMMTADPRVVPEARVIEVISFEEASELAYFGARVLHPLTLAPAIEKGIPVRIRNSREPDRRGTEVRASAPSDSSGVRSIAAKKGIATVDIVTSRMLMASGFLRTLFDVFARHDTPVDMVTTSEVSVSVTVDDLSRLHEIRRDLEEIAQVEVAGERALVCLVGQDLKYKAGIAARIFRAVEAINILMISQGASRRNVSFVVEEGDADEAVRRLHREFFG
jgi:aspartate kinase